MERVAASLSPTAGPLAATGYARSNPAAGAPLCPGANHDVCVEQCLGDSAGWHTWTPRRRLVRLLKERYRTEAVYREMKQELGLDHYEGRRYTGLNHHVTVVMCTYAFVVAERDRAFPPSAARVQKARTYGLQATAP